MMHVTFLLEPYRLLLAGYVLAVVCLNSLMYVISSFYTKKIGQKTPRAGFLIAIVLALGYGSSVLVSAESGSRLEFIRFSMIVLCAAISAASSMALFYIMKKVRK
jgi:hypothetical protein